MKLKYIITAALSALVLAACQTEPLVGSFADFNVDKSFVSIPVEGGSVKVTLTANGPWNFAKVFDLVGEDGKVVTEKDENGKDKNVKTELPSWVEANRVKGLGSDTITLSAEASAAGREAELQIECGDRTLFLIVRQGSVEAVEATAKEIMDGPDGKSYKIRGAITKIVNTTYGNWYLKDEESPADTYVGGNEDGVYIYGTLDAEGKTKNFLSLGLEVGDIVTISGPKTTYNGTVELVDVTVLKIEKALIKLLSDSSFSNVKKEGEDITVKVAVKGNGVYPSIKADWIAHKNSEYKPGVPTLFEKNPADTVTLTFTVAANESPKPRETTFTISSSSYDAEKDVTSTTTIGIDVKQGANAPDLSTIADGIAAGFAHVKGTVMAISQRGYIVADASGAFTAYYGKGFNADNYKIGDEIEFVDEFAAYNFGVQLNGDGREFVLEEKKKEGDGTVAYPTPKVIDKDALAELVASIKDKDGAKVADAIKVEYVQITGTPKQSGNFINIFLDDYTAADFSAYYIPDSFNLASYLDKKVTIRGYANAISGKVHVNIMVTSIEEGEQDVPTIEYTDLSTINAKAKDDSFELTAVVAFVSTSAKCVIVTDGTNCFYLYNPAEYPAVGDIVKATGKISVYNKLIESAAGPEIAVIESGATVPELTPNDLTSKVDAFLTTNQPAQYITVVGKYVLDDTYHNIEVSGATAKFSLKGDNVDATLNGKTVRMTGWFTGANSGGTLIYVNATSYEEQ